MPISSSNFGSGYIDSHCHLNALNNIPTQINQANQQGIHQFVVPATDVESWQSILSLKSKDIAIALGTHPWYVKDAAQEEQALAESLSCNPSAIGEIGLDFYQSKTAPRPNAQLQIESFRRQLIIAREADLPVIIHSVKAHAEVIQLLKKEKINQGVIHAFTGSVEQAQAYVKQGFCLGAGTAVFKSNKTQRAFAAVPLENIVLETDAPYVGAAYANEEMPDGNSLLALIPVANKLAEVLKLPIEEIQQKTTNNARRLFFQSEQL